MTSTTGLPATASRISAATLAALANGIARTTTSAAVAAASAFDGGGRARRWRAATVAGILGIARGDDDVVTGAAERGGECPADVAGTDDGDLHGMAPPMA